MTQQDFTLYTEAQLAEWYIKNRDWLAEAKAAYEANIDPTEKLQDEIELELQRRLNNAGASSIRTPHGSIVSSTTTSYSAEDKAAFGQYIISSGIWEATSLRPAKEFVQDYQRQNGGQLPPGVGSYTRTSITVRRK